MKRSNNLLIHEVVGPLCTANDAIVLAVLYGSSSVQSLDTVSSDVDVALVLGQGDEEAILLEFDKALRAVGLRADIVVTRRDRLLGRLAAGLDANFWRSVIDSGHVIKDVESYASDIRTVLGRIDPSDAADATIKDRFEALHALLDAVVTDSLRIATEAAVILVSDQENRPHDRTALELARSYGLLSKAEIDAIRRLHENRNGGQIRHAMPQSREIWADVEALIRLGDRASRSLHPPAPAD